MFIHLRNTSHIQAECVTVDSWDREMFKCPFICVTCFLRKEDDVNTDRLDIIINMMS